MTELVKMDIFFFITAVVVVVIGVLLAFILLRIWRILGHVEEITKEVSEESALVRGDIQELRHKIRSEGMKLSYLKTFATHALKRFVGKPKRASNSEGKKESQD